MSVVPEAVGVAHIPLSARDGSIRAYAIVDATDAHWINQWRWHLDKGYARRNEWRDGKCIAILLHRELLGLRSGDGLEDNWTKWRADGSELSDGVRYRLIGNSVAVPVIAWIGRRLRAVMEQT